nr:MAG TPA: hypothetical protein [Caudoviricetes sp.]
MVTIYSVMIRFFKRFLFARRFRRAVRRADLYAKVSGMKFLVIMLNGKLQVVSKQSVRSLVAKRRFRKGVTAALIENRALYVTR